MDNPSKKLASTEVCSHCFCASCLSLLKKGRCPLCPLCRAALKSDYHSLPGRSNLEQWGLSEARAEVCRVKFSERDADGYRNVILNDTEQSNIRVGKGVKINVGSGSRIVINGKEVENPQECAQS